MTPGVYRGLSDAQYDAIPAVRSTMLQKLIPPSTPAHFRWAELHPDPDREWAIEGRAFHAATLEPERFELSATVAREIPKARDVNAKWKHGYLSNEAKEWRDAWLAAESERVKGYGLLLDEATDARIRAMARSARDEMGEWLERSHETELTVVWRDDETGLLCKARLDCYVPGLRRIVDLKGTRKIATPETMQAEIRRYGYHRQAAWYTDGARAAGLKIAMWQPFWMCATEKAPPYLSNVLPLAGDALNTGREQMRTALRLLAECRERDVYPGHCGDGEWTIPAQDVVDSLTFDEEKPDAD